MPRCVAVNDRGYRIGEYHHRAVHSDALVDKIREMHEDRGLSYGAIAMRLKLKLRFVGKVCRYEIRAQTPDRWVRVE